MQLYKKKDSIADIIYELSEYFQSTYFAEQ